MSIHYLRTRKRPYYDIRDCPGINFNLTVNNSAAINSWLTSLASTGIPFDVELTRPVNIYSGLNIPFLPVGFKGTKNGKFIGDPAFIGLPTPIPSSRININGAFNGVVLPYTTAIPMGTNFFPYTSSGLVLGNFVQLENFPTSAGGTDFAVAQPDGSKHYPTGSITQYAGMTIDPANLRQFRRFEPMQIQHGDGSGFNSVSPCFCDYSTYHNAADALQFRVYNPNAFTSFEGINFENLFITTDLAYRFRANFCTLLNSTINIGRTLHAEVLGTFLDAQTSDCAIQFRQSRHLKFDVDITQGLINTDNGALRCSGGSDFDVKARTSGHTGRFFAAIFDSDFDESGDGYPQVPISNGKIDLIDSSLNMGAFLSGNPYALTAIENVVVNFIGNTSYSFNGVYLKGCKNCQVNMQAPQANFRIDGGQNIQFIGMKGSQFLGGYIDPRNSASVLPCTNVTQPTWVSL